MGSDPCGSDPIARRQYAIGSKVHLLFRPLRYVTCHGGRRISHLPKRSLTAASSQSGAFEH